ncbi:E3 ubiquitin-protein ligase SINA-like 10, partial [Oryza brachyantha]
MENTDPVAKKLRVEDSASVTNVRVKQEAAEDAHGGGEAATTTAAAAEVAAGVELAVRIDAAVLHCPLCLLPLKPPIFQCGAGHLACGVCHGKLSDVHCRACGDGGAAYAHNPVLDAFARSAKICCPNDKYGCDIYVTYCEVADHQRACPHTPCSCPEPGCGFLGAPPALLAHLTADHSWPAQEITYRAVHPLWVPASERRRLLFVRGDGDERRVFLLAMGAHGAATTVSVSCVRANAAAGPQYTCKVWTQAPADPETGSKDT